jgi:biopolymer transport protein ExbB
MDFLHAFSQGSIVLILVFLLLILMSFASWYIIFLKGIKLKREYKFYQNFVSTHAQEKDWPARSDFSNAEGAVKYLIDEVQTLKAILPNYDSHDAKKEILTMHLVQTLDEIRFWLDRGLTILASIGSSAPFIGLFGTVWGIYNALTDIAAQGNAGLSVVAGPMGEALVATAIGLFAAIPAVLAYNTFVRYNRLLVQNLRHIAEQMTVYISNSNSQK